MDYLNFQKWFDAHKEAIYRKIDNIKHLETNQTILVNGKKLCVIPLKVCGNKLVKKSP